MKDTRDAVAKSGAGALLPSGGHRTAADGPSTLSPAARRAVVWFTSVLGCGYAPVASGTVGTLPAVALVWLIAPLNVWGAPLLGYLAITAALYVAGVWASSLAEPVYGTKDNGRIVIDEVVGYLVTMLLLPSRSWVWLAAGFFMFRAFDVIKPPPARRLQLLSGGQGVMIDDLIAGAYACLCLHGVRMIGLSLGWPLAA